MLHFNFWYLLMPLGAAVAAIVGYCRSHRAGKYSARRDSKTAKLDYLCATILGAVLCIMIYAESRDGLYWLFVAKAQDAMGELVGLMCCVVAPVVLSVCYGTILRRVASRCSRIGLVRLRCPAKKRRNPDGRIVTVVQAADLVKLLIQNGTPKEALRNEPPQRYYVDDEGTTEDPAADEDLSPEQKLRELFPPRVPSKNLVETEVVEPDGSWHTIEIPENQVSGLKMAMMGYCASMARARAMIASMLSKKMVTAEPAEVKQAQEQVGSKTLLEDATAGLSADDRKLVTDLIEQTPGLDELVRSNRYVLHIQLKGEGPKRQAQCSMRVKRRASSA